MINTKCVVTGVREIPEEWIFEFYLNLSERLYGQELKIKSPMNSAEKNPSFTIFYEKNKRYFFKDFSSGRGGSATDLVALLFPDLKRAQVLSKIQKDYEKHLAGNSGSTDREYKILSKYKVSSFELRRWNVLDKQFWFDKYHISSKLLENYNIAPLDHYCLTKEENGVPKTLKIVRNNVYGYFRKNGDLCKIYQPMVKECKFIKVKEYIQGTDQLTGSVPNLLITKAMKDICAIHALEIPNWEIISPDSENTIISQRYINNVRLKYNNIVTLFDNDKAGYTSREVYKERYGIPYITLDLGHKDASDSIEALGQAPVKKELIKLLN